MSLDRLVARRQECLDAIRTIEAEIARIEHDLLMGTIEEIGQGRCPLTRRQQEVLAMVIEQKSNKEIATALHISVHTAKFHVSHLLERFGLESRHEIASRMKAA